MCPMAAGPQQKCREGKEEEGVSVVCGSSTLQWLQCKWTTANQVIRQFTLGSISGGEGCLNYGVLALHIEYM